MTIVLFAAMPQTISLRLLRIALKPRYYPLILDLPPRKKQALSRPYITVPIRIEPPQHKEQSQDLILQNLRNRVNSHLSFHPFEGCLEGGSPYSKQVHIYS